MQIRKAEALPKLRKMITRGEHLLADRPVRDEPFRVWLGGTTEIIEAAYGLEHPHAYTFIGRPGADLGMNVEKGLEALRAIVTHMEIELECECPESAGDATTYWDDIHPVISSVAKSRYEAQHYADSVEAAFKELNAVIKKHVLQKTGQDLDGSSLMNTAFSLKNPIVTLDDLSTDSGKNIQQGYMQIFAGAMTGIRNPKAHANITIDDKRARQLLGLASLLMCVFDERL
jgi:uncharacterized protein (TIGR02391 family)